MTDFEEIRRERLADQIYSRIKAMIMRHELLPNEKLSVPALADHFGVSRSPVREAVLQAVRDGLAIEKPRLGAFVTSFERKSLRGLFEIREMLEGLAARLAAEHHGAGDMEKIMTHFLIHKDQVKAGKLESYIEADIAFHEAILAAAGSESLQDVLGPLYQRIRVAMSMRVAPAGPALAIADHTAIVDMITRRDAAGAEQAARSHITRALDRLLLTSAN